MTMRRLNESDANAVAERDANAARDVATRDDEGAAWVRDDSDAWRVARDAGLIEGR